MKTETRKVRLTLVGLDGNAFSLMGAFSHAARRQGFEKDFIDKVLDEARSGDYNNLVYTLDSYCEEEDDADDYDYDE